MSRYRIAVLLLGLSALGATYLQGPLQTDDAIVVTTKNVLARLHMDQTIPRGVVVPVTVWIRRSPGLTFDSIRSASDKLLLTTREDESSVDDALEDSVRVVYRAHAPLSHLRRFIGSPDEEEVILLEPAPKIQVHYTNQNGKSEHATLFPEIRLGPFQPPLEQVALWSFLGLLLGFALKRWGLSLKRKSPEAEAAQPDVGHHEDPRPAAATPSRKWKPILHDFAFSAVIGTIFLAALLQEPNHFSSYFGAMLLGLGIGGLGDDHLLRRLSGTEAPS